MTTTSEARVLDDARAIVLFEAWDTGERLLNGAQADDLACAYESLVALRAVGLGAPDEDFAPDSLGRVEVGLDELRATVVRHLREEIAMQRDDDLMGAESTAERGERVARARRVLDALEGRTPLPVGVS